MDVFAVEKSVGCRFSLSDFVNIGSCFGIILSVYVELNLFRFVILYPFWNVFRYCFLFVYILLLQYTHFVWYNGDTSKREPTAHPRRRETPSAVGIQDGPTRKRERPLPVRKEGTS